MLHAVIMAGGAGTRFWPASRADRPKQLLNLAGERSMIQATVDRLGDLAPPERVLVVTNERLAASIREQLPQLPADAVLGEPAKRDTAPCIGLAAIQLARSDPDATMAVMPSDHVIEPAEAFQAAIRRAADLVDQQPRRIVTFGVKPTYPAEIYGYIERGEPLGEAAYRVAQFREKPDAADAQAFLDAGNYYWNGGIFVWKASHIMSELSRHEPEMYARLEAIADAAGTPEYDETLRREFTAIEGKSIDYAVMERAADVAVIEADFRWDDVGSWRSLSRLHGEDADRQHDPRPRGTWVSTLAERIVSARPDHLVVTIGLKDCIVVQLEDATLIAPTSTTKPP